MKPSPVMSPLLVLVFTSFLLGGEAALPQERWVSLAPVEEGTKVTLNCFLQGRPPADPHPTSYVWTKDKQVIPGERRVHLTFTSVTRQDAGIYRCENPHYNFEKLEFDLYVSGAPLPQPVISSSGYAVCGRSFSLECLILKGYSANDKTHYTWFKDGTEIQGQSSNFLSFTTVRKTDERAYTCTAREGPVKSTSPHSPAFHLVPLVSPEAYIKTTSADGVIKGILGENLTLTCAVTHAFPEVPDDGYSWSYLPSPQGQPRPLGVKASTLTLGPLTREDGGQYFCQARNDQHFQGLTLTGNASITVHIVYLQNITLTSDLEVDEGDPVTLTCSVDSHPAARLAWTIHEQEVRHVTDNRDYFFIPTASCSDSTSYTCRASNTDLPGREISATSKVLVHCKQALTAKSDTAATEISATFDFCLPDKTSMAVVHPSGQDILTVQQDCSLNISSAFLPRCLHPRCDPARRHLSFTLTRVTEEDEGNYTCREEGKERRLIPDCGKRLLLKSDVMNIPHLYSSKWTWELKAMILSLTSLILALGIFLGIRHRRRFLAFCRRVETFIRKTSRRLKEWFAASGQVMETGLSFETLYKNCKVHVLPPLIATKDMVKEDNTEEDNEYVALLPSEHLTDQSAKFIVTDLVRSILQESTTENDAPSFLLHNTRLSRQENIVLVLSRKLGVILMTVKAVEDVDKLQSMDKAVRQLLEAKKEVSKRLGGLVKPRAVTAVLTLPNVPSSNIVDVRRRLKTLRSHPDVEVLLGQEKANFQQWTKTLTSRPDSVVWNLSSPGVDSADTAYKMAASRFLTLTGCSPPEESTGQPAAEECWLLTPAQLQVRDSTARLLHIWGPPGSGKTTMLIEKAREWLAEGKAVVVAVGKETYDVLLAHVIEAIQRVQKRADRLRICRTHTMMKRAMGELQGRFHDMEIHVIIDTLRDMSVFRTVLKAVESKQAAAVWSVCRDNLKCIDAHLSSKAKELGWESTCLPDCIRCTESTVELLNLLVRGSLEYTTISACILPRPRDIPAWRVVDHCLHPQHTSTTSHCLQCKKEMAAALPSVDDGLDWRDWIALYTGNPDLSTDLKHLCITLQSLGIPATYDKEEIITSYSSRLDTSKTDFAQWQERLDAGVDEKGNPAVHLVRIRDFIGLERGGVFVVHWDQRDNDPGRQSQGEREARLKQHRRQWIQAVSRSKGQVILLLLTHSPAHALLNLPEPVLPQQKTGDEGGSNLQGQLETRVEVHGGDQDV